MGSLGRRLERLEGSDRKKATVEVRRLWERFSDEEFSLILSPHYYKQNPTPEERAAESQAREAVPETLIARAIGYSEDLSEEEISRRLREVMNPVLKRRHDRLLTQLQSQKAGLT